MTEKIFNIIDKQKLDIVSESIEKAHGLPNECYLNGHYTKIERKKIFEDKWVTIGVASSVPNPGDTKPFDLLGIPLIIIRDKNKKVRVFHNVCSHRGYKLIHEECSLTNVLRCPYHSWSYDFEGKLVATPHLGGLNKNDHEKEWGMISFQIITSCILSCPFVFKKYLQLCITATNGTIRMGRICIAI